MRFIYKRNGFISSFLFNKERNILCKDAYKNDRFDLVKLYIYNIISPIIDILIG